MIFHNELYLHVDGHVSVTVDAATTATLGRIEAAINQLITQNTTGAKTMAGEFDNLQKQVQQNHDLEESAVQLIQGIAQQLQNAQGDPAKLATLAQTLQQSATDLAAAITANTPTSTGDGGAPTGTTTSGTSTTGSADTTGATGDGTTNA